MNLKVTTVMNTYMEMYTGMFLTLGPFYLIVEHCEHGSLRSYLRKCRQNDNLYMHPGTPPPPSGQSENDEDYLTSRDLLSFSWQIAKGMQYLSEMKVKNVFFSNMSCWLLHNSYLIMTNVNVYFNRKHM